MGLSATVKVGCCGFQTSRKRYYESLGLVEIQRTFYKLPKIETARKWREEAPDTFEFTVKAWMALTHDPKSRIWGKTGLPCDESYGLLKPTERNFEVWERFREVVKELGAEVVIFQSPPSFRATEENLNNADAFFSAISGEFRLGWEIRDESWLKDEHFQRILENHGITHVVDVMYERPTYGEFRYYRLHGAREGRRIKYSYRYTDEDLSKLLGIVREFLLEDNYVLFNNSYYSFENAVQFKRMIEGYHSK